MRNAVDQQRICIDAHRSFCAPTLPQNAAALLSSRLLRVLYPHELTHVGQFHLQRFTWKLASRGEPGYHLFCRAWRGFSNFTTVVVSCEYRGLVWDFGASAETTVSLIGSVSFPVQNI